MPWHRFIALADQIQRFQERERFLALCTNPYAEPAMLQQMEQRAYPGR